MFSYCPDEPTRASSDSHVTGTNADRIVLRSVELISVRCRSFTGGGSLVVIIICRDVDYILTKRTHPRGLPLYNQLYIVDKMASLKGSNIFKALFLNREKNRRRECNEVGVYLTR